MSRRRRIGLALTLVAGLEAGPSAAWAQAPEPKVDAGAAGRLDAVFDALLPKDEPFCYAQDASAERLAEAPGRRVTSIRLHRRRQLIESEAQLGANQEPGATTATVEVTLRAPEGVDAEGRTRRMAGAAFCTPNKRLGLISCSDDNGCDSADRLRIEPAEGGLRLTVNGPFAVSGGGCGAETDEPFVQLDANDPDDRVFLLEKRPIADCQ